MACVNKAYSNFIPVKKIHQERELMKNLCLMKIRSLIFQFNAANNARTHIVFLNI